VYKNALLQELIKTFSFTLDIQFYKNHNLFRAYFKEVLLSLIEKATYLQIKKAKRLSVLKPEKCVHPIVATLHGLGKKTLHGHFTHTDTVITEAPFSSNT
jgi:hypothetical protein